MRKDKGLNGDLDRLPLLTWVMFLKFLDDLEHQRGDEAKLSGERFRPVIEAPYRWRGGAQQIDPPNSWRLALPRQSVQFMQLCRRDTVNQNDVLEQYLLALVPSGAV